MVVKPTPKFTLKLSLRISELLAKLRISRHDSTSSTKSLTIVAPTHTGHSPLTPTPKHKHTSYMGLSLVKAMQCKSNQIKANKAKQSKYYLCKMGNYLLGQLVFCYLFPSHVCKILRRRSEK
jgi:hypothetical protein